MNASEELDRLLSFADSPGTSLHLLPGRPPFLRERGETWVLDADTVSATAVTEVAKTILTDMQFSMLNGKEEIYSNYACRAGQFRVIMAQSTAGVHATFRRMSGDVLEPDVQDNQPIYAELASMRRGLVIVCGPIATDNQSLLESLTAWLSQHRSGHLITVEDRPGRCYEDTVCALHQLEVGRHVKTLSEGVDKAVFMRSDVVTTTRIDSAETFESLVSAAESGLVALSTIESRTLGAAFDTLRKLGGARTHARLAFALQLLIQRTRNPGKNATETPVFTHDILANTDEIADILLHADSWQSGLAQVPGD